MIRIQSKLSYDYIRGLVERDGCFSFSTIPTMVFRDGDFAKKKLPSFMLQMSGQNRSLIELVKETLGLKNRIYEYKRKSKKDNNNHSMVILNVRDFGQIKNIVVPFFYKKLRGDKAKQFEDWIYKIGNDPDVEEKYRLICKIYKEGFYERNPKFIN